MSMDFAPVIDAVRSTRPIIFDKALSSSVKMRARPTSLPRLTCASAST